MTRETEMRVKAFVRTIANVCDTCQRRGDACYDCIARQAKMLLNDIASEEVRPIIDYSFRSRVAEIKRILEAAGCPLLAKDICIKTCSAQLKNWTLNQMVCKGILGRKPAYEYHKSGSPHFYYYIKSTESK